MTAATVHGLTRSFAAAAKSAGPPGTRVRAEPHADDGTDHLDITLISRDVGSRAAADRSRMLQALNSVAVAGRLTQESSGEQRGAITMIYRRNGTATHTIYMRFGVAGTGGDANKSAGVKPDSRNAATGQARLAILLDDLGTDLGAADEILRLPYPVTIAVLPGHAHSVEIANEAMDRGYEVMLHLPMQSIGKEQPEARELRPGMDSGHVSALVEQFLGEVPGVSGVNNHQGSQATADPALMGELMPVLRERHLFYVDSRTTAATVAYDTAKRDGVEAGFRNVPFLDDVDEEAAIEKQLALAIRGAREKGEAIAIGHPHASTLQALRTLLPKAQAAGVQLVNVSDLVH